MIKEIMKAKYNCSTGINLWHNSAGCRPNSSWKQWTAPSVVSSCDLAMCRFGAALSAAAASALFLGRSEWDELPHEFLPLWGPDECRNLIQQQDTQLALLNVKLILARIQQVTNSLISRVMKLLWSSSSCVCYIIAEPPITHPSQFKLS